MPRVSYVATTYFNLEILGSTLLNWENIKHCNCWRMLIWHVFNICSHLSSSQCMCMYVCRCTDAPPCCISIRLCSHFGLFYSPQEILIASNETLIWFKGEFPPVSALSSLPPSFLFIFGISHKENLRDSRRHNGFLWKLKNKRTWKERDFLEL